MKRSSSETTKEDPTLGFFKFFGILFFALVISLMVAGTISDSLMTEESRTINSCNAACGWEGMESVTLNPDGSAVCLCDTEE